LLTAPIDKLRTFFESFLEEESKSADKEGLALVT
jgi:hypothetical protein